MPSDELVGGHDRICLSSNFVAVFDSQTATNCFTVSGWTENRSIAYYGARIAVYHPVGVVIVIQCFVSFVEFIDLCYSAKYNSSSMLVYH